MDSRISSDSVGVKKNFAQNQVYCTIRKVFGMLLLIRLWRGFERSKMNYLLGQDQNVTFNESMK